VSRAEVRKGVHVGQPAVRESGSFNRQGSIHHWKLADCFDVPTGTASPVLSFGGPILTIGFRRQSPAEDAGARLRC
jgi:hypothetical protein